MKGNKMREIKFRVVSKHYMFRWNEYIGTAPETLSRVSKHYMFRWNDKRRYIYDVPKDVSKHYMFRWN